MRYVLVLLLHCLMLASLISYIRLDSFALISKPTIGLCRDETQEQESTRRSKHPSTLVPVPSSIFSLLFISMAKDLCGKTSSQPTYQSSRRCLAELVPNLHSRRCLSLS